MSLLKVGAPGLGAGWQGLQRRGSRRFGVPPGGAMDRPALTLANRIVGNDEALAGVEMLVGGCVLRARATMTIAVTGAPGGLRVAGRAA